MNIQEGQLGGLGDPILKISGADRPKSVTKLDYFVEGTYGT